MALGDHPNLRERIGGVACLATPFIAAQDRNIGRNAWPILIKGTALAMVFLLGTLLMEAYLLFKADNVADRLHGVVTPHAMMWHMVISAVYGLVVSLVFLLRNRVRRHASKLRRELRPRPLDEKSQLLIIRSPADEASGLIGVFQFLSQTTVRLFLFGETCYVSAVALVEQPTRKHLWMGIYWFVAGLAFVALLMVVVRFSNSLWLIIPTAAGYMISLMVSFFGIALALYDGLERLSPRLFSWPKRFIITYFGSVLAMLCWLIIPVLSMLLVLPFGWQAALANILLDVTAETTPPGSWKIHLIEPPTSEELGGPVPPLMHKVYENPRVHQKLNEWIETRGSGATKVS